jgi:hypothetical protein
MHLAGAGKDDLVGLRVTMSFERGIFLDQALQRQRRFLFVGSSPGPNRERNYGRGLLRLRIDDDRFFVGESIAGGGVFELRDRDYLAGERGL